MELLLNTSVHSSTGFTPYFITHGQELSEQGTDHSLFRRDQTLSEEERTAQRKETFTKIYALVSKNLAKAHDSSRKQYNLRHRRFAKPFTVGQLVFRKNMKLSSAIDHYSANYVRQHLPCKITAKRGTNSYQVEDLEGKDLGIWPATHLKP